VPDRALRRAALLRRRWTREIVRPPLVRNPHEGDDIGVNRYADDDRSDLAGRRSPVAMSAPIWVAVLVLGCGSSSPKATNPQTTLDGGVCSRSLAIGALEPGESLASGSITGPTLSALVCGVSVELATTEGSAFDFGDSPFIALFNWTGSPFVDFQLPSAATPTLFQANIGISAAATGSYSSADGACGFVTFGYDAPVVPSADCAAATIPCPAGCAPNCADGGCQGCVQFQSAQSYQANGASNCLVAEQQQPSGSWTLSLDSVAPAGQGLVVHGSLFAVLSGQQSADSASLALAF
jgi:hypothetical protein